MWAQDYCTVCDKQCSPGAVYCSEKCKLQELNRSTDSLQSLNSVSLSMYSNGKFHNLSSPVINGKSPSPSSTTSSSPATMNKKFLYDSPLLKPQMKESHLPSPPLSPLIIATTNPSQSISRTTATGFYSYSHPCRASTSPESPSENHISHQTSATYRKWLTAVV